MNSREESKLREMLRYYDLRPRSKQTVSSFHNREITVMVTGRDVVTGFYQGVATNLDETTTVAQSNPWTFSPTINPLIERNNQVATEFPFVARANRRGEHSTLGTLWEFDFGCCSNSTGTGTGTGTGGVRSGVECCSSGTIISVPNQINLHMYNFSNSAVFPGTTTCNSNSTYDFTLTFANPLPGGTTAGWSTGGDINSGPFNPWFIFISIVVLKDGFGNITSCFNVIGLGTGDIIGGLPVRHSVSVTHSNFCSLNTEPLLFTGNFGDPGSCGAANSPVSHGCHMCPTGSFGTFDYIATEL